MASPTHALRRRVKHLVAAAGGAHLALPPAAYLAALRTPGLRASGVGRLPVRVPLDACIGYTGFPYRRGGWHYLVEVLRELDANPALDAGDSLLARFHERFQPTSAYHLVETFTPAVRFRPGLGVLPWGEVTGAAPAATKDWTTSRWYGPSSEAVIRDEFARFREASVSIRSGGYDPWRKGFVAGQFLVAADGGLRYVVLQGNHRMAVMAHIGYDSVVTRALPGHPFVIDERDCERWPYVRSGACSADDALAYFRAYFQATGFEQGRRHELIP